jgi:hypothetical protein
VGAEKAILKYHHFDKQIYRSRHRLLFSALPAQQREFPQGPQQHAPVA